MGTGAWKRRGSPERTDAMQRQPLGSGAGVEEGRTEWADDLSGVGLSVSDGYLSTRFLLWGGRQMGARGGQSCYSHRSGMIQNKEEVRDQAGAGDVGHG